MHRHRASNHLNPSINRRQVMIGAAGLTFALALRGEARGSAMPAATISGKAVSPWVSIGADGTISIMSPATEMGQGTFTSLPRVLAEELDADWDKVRVVAAPPVEQIYGNPGYGGMMYTAGSNAVTSYFTPMRTFGAQVRRVLLDNAARKLGVPLDELTTEPSVVVHARTGRRLSYGEIAAFAEIPDKAPEIKPEQLKKPSEFRLIGKDAMRVELPGKVNGSAPYAIDVQLPGMLYGAVLRAPVEGAGPDKIDEAVARAIAGVEKIVRLPYGVGIIATTPWAAFEAKESIARSATWTRSGTAWGFDSDQALEKFAADAADPSSPATDWDRQGDVRGQMPKAAVQLEAEYRCDYAYHAQMEPLNATAQVSPGGDSVEIWVGTQSQTTSVETAAKALGVSRDKVKLNYTLMGGGFGRRGHREVEFVTDAVLLAKESGGKPVKVMWTREDDVHNGRFRPLSAHHLRAGLDSSGRIIAWHHRIAADRVTPFVDPVRFERGGRKDAILMRGVELKSYDIPNQLSQQLHRDTGVRTAPLRGIGFTANKFVTEAFLDEVAEKRGIDPLALRIELLKDTPRGRKVVETVARMADWGRKREGRGLGFAFIDYSNTLLAGIAEVSVNRSIGAIRVHRFWCAIDCGVAVHPDNVVAQTESSIVYGLGLTQSERISIKNGAVEQSNFYDYPVPRMNEVPEMFVTVVQTPHHPTGVGQMATPLVAPAVAAGFAQLTGRRLRHSPFTPERVKAALA
jgi:isoquinoline 1-oxidoreductase beta subunit